jgi:hypothetical protein
MTQADMERLSQLSEELKEIADLMNGESEETESAEISFTPSAPKEAKEGLTEIVIYFRRYQEGKRRLRELIPKVEEVMRKEKGQNNKALGELIAKLKRRAR